MNHSINAETIKKLISKYKEDKDFLEEIFTCLQSFEDYHFSIFKMQTTSIVLGGDLCELDNARTVCHNLVIANIRMLNDWAEKLGFEPVYTGVVSEERPHRRNLADAVLVYVEDIIKNRSNGLAK